MIEEDLNNIINDDVINYQHKDLQLIINDENIFLNPYGLLNDQHMAIAMQMLYVQKLEMLGYQQHTYIIIHRYLSKCSQHIFINNNHWILVQIHTTTPDLHCIIYDSNTPRTKILLDDTIQLLTKIINVEHLLYTYANVMQ